jgi:hypothetical protein
LTAPNKSQLHTSQSALVSLDKAANMPHPRIDFLGNTSRLRICRQKIGFLHSITYFGSLVEAQKEGFKEQGENHHTQNTEGQNMSSNIQKVFCAGLARKQVQHESGNQPQDRCRSNSEQEETKIRFCAFSIGNLLEKFKPRTAYALTFSVS